MNGIFLWNFGFD